MKDSCFKTLSASELLGMTNHPEFCRLVLQEHAEVMEIPLKGTTSQSLRKENSKKNRFSNIPCWGHSRVIINARENFNFDVGDRDPSRQEVTWKKTQRLTFTRATLMDSKKSVNIDRDHEKSYYLWTTPKGSETTFGSFVAKILDIREELSFTRTRVKITNKIMGTSREITNFWFGWAGTYCAIDNALELLEKEKEVSVAKIVLKIRSQKHSSVFLPEQYEFCYLVLKYVILEETKKELSS
ncbi:unnamed protein product [Euphydryas editha]|uniref:Tyrosine-protein phosphatase domain-containing protein n=1 Tax=Euphydryas editha TaxID=104508 RepID=A0AAU9U7W4_EUPED|nr:unnamed protein product [Euphydryas editha]